MNVMWAVTGEMDAEYGTDYKARLKKWILQAEEKGLTVSGTFTDPKAIAVKHHLSKPNRTPTCTWWKCVKTASSSGGPR